MPKTKDEKILEELPVNPEQSAELAELQYVSDTDPGITRKKNRRGFIYLNPKGEYIKDKKILKRINSLVIPPAWTDVWICSASKGHIQVTGRDVKKRKQYIYHPKWDAIRNQTKFFRLIKFAQSLPLIRKRVESDLRKHDLTREKVLAIITRLLEETLIRIGNQEYAVNGSYGLTTLKDKHLVVDGGTIQLVFKGKSGKVWEVDILNKRLARLVKQCQELPGQELFQYINSGGEYNPVTSTDVNNYICEITGENFTAKDFRTWGGTLLAAKELFSLGPAESDKDFKKKTVKAVKNVAKALNNTTSICRNYYIHPDIIETFYDKTLFVEMKKAEANGMNNRTGFSAHEKAVMKILKNKLAV
ncbi:MAG: hypothetical protein R6W90_01070 [Ignavibacteriaceae bacterium]